MVARRCPSIKFTHTLSVLLALYSEISTAVYRRDYMQHRNTRTLRGLNAGLIGVKSGTIRLPMRITKVIFFKDMYVFQNPLGNILLLAENVKIFRVINQ